ncbi:MAG: TlpA family protein disulfide reductase [Deltaproteobacteria bacterium]|nr:TlpA family protein disulfide reductase [Deltaproteobacteria bacterium]
MKKVFQYVVVLLGVLFPLYASATQPPAAGDSLPALKFSVPAEREDREYLGLPGGDFFEVSQVKAEVVILEVMSMYCPFCQKEAPAVNELYRLIEENPKLKNRIKLIGIGAGNSPYELKVFREKYQVPFPLVPDRDFAIHVALGEVRTPFFIGVRMKNGVPTVFYSKLGGFEDAGAFLGEILRLSGLQ